MPRKVFTAGEVLAASDVNTFLMNQAVMTFAGTAARGSAIGSATEGMVTYLADTDTFQFFDGSSYQPFGVPLDISVDFLVIAGGGGGGGNINFANNGSGGGGAGGYRTSFGTSGGGAAAESAYIVNPNKNYTVTVGAGGAGGVRNAPNPGVIGSDSLFAFIRSVGGGRGDTCATLTSFAGVGGNGGGGGGLAYSDNRGFAIVGQGSDGRGGFVNAPGAGGGGGGGGASARGGAPANPTGGTGGAGQASTITGTSITRAGGGAGGHGLQSGGAGAAGGTGGGGQGGGTNNAVAGTVNTGGGGGGGAGSDANQTYANGAAGGSGVVFLRYSNTLADLVVGSGLVIDNGSGGNVSGTGTRLTPSFSPTGAKVYMFKSGTGNVSW